MTSSNRQFNVKMPKTYASVANAEKAVEKSPFAAMRYVIAVDATGRYFPCFVGQEAIGACVHFSFAVVG